MLWRTATKGRTITITFTITFTITIAIALANLAAPRNAGDDYTACPLHLQPVMSTPSLRTVLLCFVAVSLAGCSRDDIPAGVAAEEPLATEPPTDTADVWRPDEERRALPSNRIYYTLTDYGWYARAEPLLHDGRAHVAAGLPIAASAAEMTKAGEYDGVEFYTRADSTAGVLYVPVFEGYWLGFRPDNSAPAAKVADSAAR